jgi:biopolymer transport protein TolR
MAMRVGTTRSAIVDVNVTPLIDVLLVLLIIFMVITPNRTVGLEAAIPQPSPEKSSVESDAAVVVQVDRTLSVRINSELVDMHRLGNRLVEIFKLRAERVVYVKADRDVEFWHVARMVDIARGAGISRIGLLGDRF